MMCSSRQLNYHRTVAAAKFVRNLWKIAMLSMLSFRSMVVVERVLVGLNAHVQGFSCSVKFSWLCGRGGWCKSFVNFCFGWICQRKFIIFQILRPNLPRNFWLPSIVLIIKEYSCETPLTNLKPTKPNKSLYSKKFNSHEIQYDPNISAGAHRQRFAKMTASKAESESVPCVVVAYTHKILILPFTESVWPWPSYQTNLHRVNLNYFHRGV